MYDDYFQQDDYETLYPPQHTSTVSMSFCVSDDPKKCSKSRQWTALDRGHCTANGSLEVGNFSLIRNGAWRVTAVGSIHRCNASSPPRNLACWCFLECDLAAEIVQFRIGSSSLIYRCFDQRHASTGNDVHWEMILCHHKVRLCDIFDQQMLSFITLTPFLDGKSDTSVLETRHMWHLVICVNFVWFSFEWKRVVAGMTLLKLLWLMLIHGEPGRLSVSTRFHRSLFLSVKSRLWLTLP